MVTKKTVAKVIKTSPSQPAEKAKPATKAKPAARPKPASKTSKKAKTRALPVKQRPDVVAIAERLAVAIPEPRHELSFRTPFELLIATILAAQSTDRAVNQVMPTLLARFPTAHELALAGQDEVEILVKRTGFFRNKARAIREASQQLVALHAGEVPNTMEALTALPGVARKTANVVLGTAFGINVGFVVDTHVSRVTQRLRLTRQTDPVRIEEDLCRTFEQGVWTDLGHRFTLHGRYTCLAKAPMCSECPLNELCFSRENEPSAAWEERAVHEHARVGAGITISQTVLS